MSAIDTAKEIARIAVTSGLSSEIIELLEKKITLLTEQIATLESENTNLKKKVENLEQQLASLNPQPGGLDQVSFKFLKLLFEHDELSITAVQNNRQRSQEALKFLMFWTSLASLRVEVSPSAVQLTQRPTPAAVTAVRSDAGSPRDHATSSTGPDR